MKKSNWSRVLFLTMFMLVGLVMLGIGIFFTVDRNQKMKTYETVRGGIVDYQAREGENGMLYGAVYAYEVDGKEYTIYDDVFTNKVPQIGKRVEVMYDPAYPGDAFVKGAMSNGFFLIILGGLFFVAPLFLLIISSGKLSSKWAEAFQGTFLGLIFMGVGYGFCFGLKQGINFVTIFLFLFGSVGVYCVGYSIYILFKPEKQREGSLENKEGNWQQEQYYVPDEQNYQGDGLKIQLQREQVEKIEKVGNVVKKGVSIAAAIQRIVAGFIFAGVGGYMISVIVNPNVTVTGMPRLPVVIFLGAFVVVGISQVVKGILEIVRK